MDNHQCAALIVSLQFAWWCGLGLKWLLLTPPGQNSIREEATSEETRCTVGFSSHET
jgi:hypothetical protein